METPSMIFLLSFFILLLKPSHSKTVIVDGFTEWRNPSIFVGDTLIFKHNYHYNLYIFQNRRAFKLCNFTEATLLTKPNSTSFTWHPSRLGFFYFSFNNGSSKTCGESEKLAVRVVPRISENRAISPEFPPLEAPSPTSGGSVSSSPAYSFPSLSPQASSPSPAPSARVPATIPPIFPDKGGGIPFINSNPAVPLPTGETDAATIRPLPISSHRGQVVGLLAYQIPLFLVVWLIL